MLGKPGSHGRVIGFAAGLCAVYYAWIMALAPGDFQGDSRMYLDIAARMKSGSFDITGYRYLRGLFYPWLVSVTWGDSGFWTYFVQAALFLTSLGLALRVLVLDSLYGLLPLSAAMIPSVAFLQRQVYPDGILMSLTLLLFVGLARRRWIACALLGLILTATKLVFVVVLPLTLAAYILDRKPVRPAHLVRAAIVGVALTPVFALLAAYAFVDLAYMVVFARPYSHGHAVDRLLPPSDLKFECGGVEHRVSRGEFFLDPITVPHAVAKYGPLTRERATSLGCGPGDLRSLKWQLLRHGFAADPMLHFRLAGQHWATALVGGYYVGHVSYVLQLRDQSWRTHYDPRSYFEPLEIQLQPEFREKGVDISLAGPSPIFALHRFSVKAGEPIVRWAAVGLLVVSLAIGLRRHLLARIFTDPVNVALVLFLVVYSGSVALLGPFVYDRYTYVNLLCLCILAARLAAQTLAARAPLLPAGMAVET